MKFEKLLEPYNENGRTSVGQVAWLRQKGFPEDIISEAMMSLYNELNAGKCFNDGHLVDRHLLELAVEHQYRKDFALTRRAEKEITTFIESIGETIESWWIRFLKWIT